MRIPKVVSMAVVLSLLILALVPAAARAQAGQAPKPGLASCAGKFEGRYGPAAGPGPTIMFHAGKATLREPDMVMTNGK
jgi:hypothetical protein